MSDHIPVAVVDTSTSPNARLRPVPLTVVKLTDSFWAPRLRINRDVTLPTQYQLLEETGRIDNFRAAAGKNPAEYGRPELVRFVRSGVHRKWQLSIKRVLESGRFCLCRPRGERLRSHAVPHR